VSESSFFFRFFFFDDVKTLSILLSLANSLNSSGCTSSRLENQLCKNALVRLRRLW